jgi:hypothetical protein
MTSRFNCLVMGPVGTGKTTSLETIPQAKHPLFVLSTEPGIANILSHDMRLCHWCYVPPAAEDWDTLRTNAVTANTMTMDQLQKQNPPNRNRYRQFVEVLDACANFKCDVCGETFGPVDDLPQGSVFALDGLSGLSKMSMDLINGGKLIATQPEWGAAMGNLERFIGKCTSDLTPSFVLISHVDRESDELTLGTKLMVSTLGRKLAPRIPKFFDECVFAVRKGNKFLWSTTEPGVDLKVRRLPFSDALAPNFAPLLDPRNPL